MTRQLYRYHPIFGYQFIPGLRARVQHEGGGYLMQTNGSGFRCRHEFERTRAPGRFRILLFGDSYTAGDGVSDGNRYAELLEQLVPNVEVFNYGLPGSGTDQQYLIWRELASDIEHDLIICSVLVENIRRVNARARMTRNFSENYEVRAKPYFERDLNGDLTLHQVPVPKQVMRSGEGGVDEGLDQEGRFIQLRRLVNKLGPEAKALVQRLTRYDPVPSYRRHDDPRWLLLEAILRRWTTEAKESKFLICPLPLHQHVEESASARAYQQRFAELESPPRVQIHDPLPALRDFPMATRRSFRFEHDVHPTEAGHRILAISLANAVRPLVAEAMERN